jgi:hypothetical protein
MDCIAATIHRLVEVAVAEAALCQPPLAAAQQLELARQWVLGVVGRPEPLTFQYKGQQMRGIMQQLAEQELVNITPPAAPVA